MKVVQINTTCGNGSTGKICIEVSKLLTENGIENYILYSFGKSDYPLGIKYTSDIYVKLQAFASQINGQYGFNSKSATKRLILQLEKISPDIVHLHNLHGHNCDIGLLLSYLKKKKIRIFWTFHDCWAFTAYCPYFDIKKCDKWKTVCGDCPSIKHYSWFLDKSSELYNRKKVAFEGLDCTIITPSQWLADMVKQSFLKDYPVKVIRNGIDLAVFKITSSDFRKKYDVGNRYIVLGVAFDWGNRKGLDVFIELEKQLERDKYQIVLVGTDNNVDKKLPENIISIHRTNNQTELAEIYTAADVFVNPTREEVLGLVNVEALACGTPGVTFNSGGSPECYDETCGMVVACNDVTAMKNEIIRICQTKPYSFESCLERAKRFDNKNKFQKYIDLYFNGDRN